MNILNWVAALIPILLLLLLLIYYKWGGDEAALAGLVSASLIAYLFFGSRIDLIASALAKGMWNALSIILVIFTALTVYEVSNESGAFSVFRTAMQNFTPNKVLQVLAVGWVFVGFLQGITGFGVPVAVGAPLLIGLGVKPLTAVMVTLLGQAWGNTFGTLGIAWDGLLGQVDLSNPLVYKQTILWTTGMLGLVNLVAGMIITGLAGGYKGFKKNIITVLVLGLLQGVGQMWLALLNPALSNFIIAAVSLVVIFLIGKHPYYRQPEELHDPAEELVFDRQYNGMKIHQAFIPYYFLIFITLFVLLNNKIKNYLGQWKLALPFAGKTTMAGFSTKAEMFYAPISPLIHSGAFLLLAALIGYWYYRRAGYIKRGGLQRIFQKSLAKTLPSAVAVIGLTAMSKVMDESGQTVVLAQGVAAATGSIYPLLAPFVGLLGTFMTSSNLSSNILFGGFQQTVASLLKVDKAPILAAQTVGGAIGSIVAPSKVLLGTTTAGILGQEGNVIRKFLLVAMMLCAAFGLLILVFLKSGW